MQTNVFRAIALVAALSSIGPLPLYAADVPLTLQQLISAARENNGDLNALRKEAAIGEAAREKAGLLANPVFEVEGNSAALSGNASENTFSLGLSQEFSTGGRRQKRLAAAEAEMARLKSRLADAERLLLLDVNTGYFDLLLAEMRLTLAQQAHDLNTQLLVITKERFAAGDVAEMDVNLAKVEAARSFARKTAAERAVAPAKLKLLSLIGSTSGTEVKVDLGRETKPVEMNLAELKTLALSRRPDLLALEAEKNRSEAEVNLARAERLPNVTAGLSFSRESTEISLRGVSERDTDYLIGLKLSLPIPVFDRNRAPVMEAQAKKSSAEIRLQTLRQNIEREVENAHAGLAAAQEVLKIYSSEIMPQLQENLKLVQEAYKLGETGIITVIDEQKKFLEVTDGYLAAQFEKNAAEARLSAAVGIDVTDPDGGKK